MALLSAEIDGFNSDEASLEEIAATFTTEYGPFTSIEEINGDFDRTLLVSGPKGRFRITASSIYDDDILSGSEVEIFQEGAENNEGTREMLEKVAQQQFHSN